MRRYRKQAFYFVIIAIAAVIFQNCGQGFRALNINDGLSSVGSTPLPSPTPSASPVGSPLPTPTATPVSEVSTDEDFLARCQAAGVVKCIGFDTLAEIAPELHPAGDGQMHSSIDSSVKASGSGSLKFEIPGNSGENSSGYFLSGLGQVFGQNSKFYVQFRQRFSQQFLANDYSGNGWKQIILHKPGSSCTGIQLVIQNSYLRGYPQMYSACGADGFADQRDGTWYYQQGDYNCRRNMTNPTDCSLYVPDQWMTFQIEVEVGDYTTASSNIRAYVAYPGGPLRQFINKLGYNFREDQSTDRFEYIQLTPYHTNKDINETMPVAHTWYDEVIISTQPIAAPKN